MHEQTAQPEGIRPRISVFCHLLPWVFAAATAFVLAIGVVFVVLGFIKVRRAQESLSWPKTDGAVVDARAELIDRRVRSGRPGRTGHRAAAVWWPKIRYAYNVDGYPFESERISFGTVFRSSNPTHANQVVQRYEKGTRVSVHYDPDDPSEAVIEPGAPASSYLSMWLGLGATIMSLVFGLFTRSLFKNRAPQTGGKMPDPATDDQLLGPGPRKLPLSARIHVVTGGFLNQFAWIMVLAATVFATIWVKAFAAFEEPLMLIGVALGLLAIAVGVTLLGIGFFRAKRNLKLLSRGKTALARLIDSQRTNAEINGRPVYRLTFEFQTEDGIERSITASTSEPERFDEASEEIVLFDQNDSCRNTVLKLLPVSLEQDDFGRLVHANRGQGRLCLVAPSLLPIVATNCIMLLLA